MGITKYLNTPTKRRGTLLFLVGCVVWLLMAIGWNLTHSGWIHSNAHFESIPEPKPQNVEGHVWKRGAITSDSVRYGIHDEIYLGEGWLLYPTNQECIGLMGLNTCKPVKRVQFKQIKKTHLYSNFRNFIRDITEPGRNTFVFITNWVSLALVAWGLLMLSGAWERTKKWIHDGK